jgi:hypothetical protein
MTITKVAPTTPPCVMTINQRDHQPLSKRAS